MLNYEVDLQNIMRVAHGCVNKFGIPYFLYGFEWYTADDYDNFLHLIETHIKELNHNISLTFQQQEEKDILCLLQNYVRAQYDRFKEQVTVNDLQTQSLIQSISNNKQCVEDTEAMLNYINQIQNYVLGLTEKVQTMAEEIANYQLELMAVLELWSKEIKNNECQLRTKSKGSVNQNE